ncbi:hypothetical protein VTK56DRAFT_5793 [Thermocarpiscus australiensis]
MQSHFSGNRALARRAYVTYAIAGLAQSGFASCLAPNLLVSPLTAGGGHPSTDDTTGIRMDGWAGQLIGQGHQLADKLSSEILAKSPLSFPFRKPWRQTQRTIRGSTLIKITRDIRGAARLITA